MTNKAPSSRPVWDVDPFEPAEKIQAAFTVFGFVVVRRVLDRQQVLEVRAELDRAFTSPHLQPLPLMCSTELLRREAIWRHLFAERVIRPLRAALGPRLCYQHDLDVQRNSFGQGGLQRHKGWHMDAGSETSHAYLQSPGYRFAKCGIFLQDWNNGWGGGIRVKPKSHRRFFETSPLKRRLFFLRRVLDQVAIKAQMDVDTLDVPTKAGDLCFFDSRLLHSSVLPSDDHIQSIGYDQRNGLGTFWPDIPPASTKYVVYWDACNESTAQDFLKNSVRRAELEPADMKEAPGRPAVFSRILSLDYPGGFPPEFVEAARRCEVAVASLSATEASFYRQKLKSMQLIHP